MQNPDINEKEQNIQENKEIRLGTEKLGKLIFSMGMPVLLAQIINLLYNIVDRSYIGHIPEIGAIALTGVGLTVPILIIIGALAALACGGGAPLASIALGKGDREKAEKILGNAVALLVLFAIFIMVLFYVIEEPFLYFFGASDATIGYATEYLNVYLLGTFFVQVTVGLNSFITAQGRSGIAMVSVLIGAFLNIVLDPIFIFAFDMGVKGAAVATVISQGISAVWVLSFLMGKKASLRLRLSKMKLEGSIVKHMMALGISPFIMQSTEAMISLVMNSGLQTFGGDLYVGSLTILQSVMQMITLPASGFAQGVMPVISYNYGAGNKERVKETFRKLLMVMLSMSALISLAAIFLPRMFGNMFTNDAEMLSLVEKVLPIFVFGMIFFGLQMTCQNMFIALGQAKISLFIACLRKIILLIPLALILPRVTGTVMGIYFAEPIADLISVTSCTVLFAINFKKILEKDVK